MAEQNALSPLPQRDTSDTARETAAHESEQRLRLALTAGGIGTWRFDFIRNLGTASARTWEIFGRAGQDTLTIDAWTQAIHPDDRQSAGEAFESAIRSGVFNMDYRIVRDDGELRWVGVAGSLTRDAEGGPITLDGIIIDITERKMAQDALMAFNARLEQRVTERTEALHQSHEQLRELSAHMETTREDERTRIAREVHDELGGALTVLKIGMGSLAWGREGDADYMARMTDLKAQLDDIVQIVRRIGSDLRPPVLDDLGLLPALEWHAREFQKRTGIVCRIDLLEEEPALTREQRTAVFRVFQEALTNVARHAQATNVIATMGIDDGELVLVIEDNGVGIDPQQLAAGQSLGLKGMQERMKEAGGAVEIEGEAGQGAIVVIHAPVQAK